MTETHVKGRAKQIALAIGAFCLASVIVIWSWNTLAVDLFGLSHMQFKHAVAVVLLLGLVRFALGRSRRPETRRKLKSA